MHDILIGLAVTVGGALILAVGAGLFRSLTHQGRKLDAISDVVVGTPADPIRGTKAIPSVAARLGTMEETVASLQLTVAARDELSARIAGWEAWRDEHMRTCSRSA
jgi:hypothetical protein